MRSIERRLERLETIVNQRSLKTDTLQIELVIVMPGPSHPAWISNCAEVGWNPSDPETWVDDDGARWLENAEGHLIRHGPDTNLTYNRPVT